MTNTTETTTDIITLGGGFILSSLVKTPIGYRAVIEKEIPTSFHPHSVTKFKYGSGRTQREAVNAAINAKGYAQEGSLHGTK